MTYNVQDIKIQRYAMWTANALDRAWRARTKKKTIFYAFSAGGNLMVLIEAVIRRAYP